MNKLNLVLVIFLIPVFSAFENESERSLSRQERKVFFPQFTVLQLSMCLVAQVSSLPSHKVSVNHGFQINYGLPFRLKDFYSPIFWARSFSNVSSPMLDFFEKLAHAKSGDDEGDEKVGEENLDEDEDETSDETTTEEPEEETTSTEKPKRKRKPKMKREIANADLTAGQFYAGLAETLRYAGYHEDCLLKSVCELARHPLHDIYDDDVVNDVLHFVLTPSLHQSFDHESESYEKALYEEAEEMGKLDYDCDALYGDRCPTSPLHKISRFIHPTNAI